MSVTESKAKTERKSSRKPAKTQETVLSALLAQTEEVSVPLASLIKSPLNVRTVPYSAESVSELADSIKGVGLLQNLVVHALPGDRYGVAAGGRRLAALNMLAERDIIQADWPVRVKVIPQELATAASMTENGHRRDMHPAEQIAGFRAMAQEGKTPAQIGDLLGYSATTRVAMWTAWRSMPPCWKNSRLSLNTFGKPKAGNGAPDAWSLSVSAVKIPGHTATCRSRKRC